MCLRKGEPSEGLDFYSLLCKDDEFCQELGRAVLAAGRLESALIQYVSQNAPSRNTTRATLGQLITRAKKHDMLSRMLPALESVRDQRNYLTHSIHALFSGLVEETILERSNLLDSDVNLFIDRAWQLADNLNGLAEILENHRKKPTPTVDR